MQVWTGSGTKSIYTRITTPELTKDIDKQERVPDWDYDSLE